MSDALDIAALDAQGLPLHRRELVAVYRDAYADKIENQFSAEDRYWERVEAYAGRVGFSLVEGRINGELIGYALGFTLPEGSGWWAGLLNANDEDLFREDGSRTFALTYIMVRQGHRRRGYAHLLHDALLRNRSESRATLLVDPTNFAARRAYKAWGWTKVGDLKPFPDSPTYEALILPLRKTAQTADREESRP